MFGNNRKSIHVNARCGPGGVAFLVNEEFNDFYDINVADDSVDGISWFCFKDLLSHVKVYACYLPPNNSAPRFL